MHIFDGRPMWSDKTGRHGGSKESVRLPGEGWAWAGDWLVDHQVIPGVMGVMG